MLTFGEFELDPAGFELRRAGQRVHVEPQVLEVLVYLVEHRHRVVRKEELLDEVWGDRFVSESALTSRIKSIRQAVGDDGRTQHVIRTVHGRGYQFLPLVTELEGAIESSAANATMSLEDARQSAGRGEWAAARSGFAAIGVDRLDAADLERWGHAAWWTNHLLECIAVRRHAYRNYVDQGDPVSAARVAIALADDYDHRGATTVHRTWLAEAERRLEGHADVREVGMLLRARCEHALTFDRDPERALVLNEQLRSLLEQIDDPDLRAHALQDHGRCLVALGRVEDGMALVDAAMLVVASGTTSAETTGRLYCNMLSVSIGLAHYRRAMDWSDEAVSWCAAHSDSAFPGLCQVHRSSLARRFGALRDVVVELEALTSSPSSYISGGALLELGAAYVRLGELDAAEAALLAAHGYGHDATAGLAELALAQDRPADAFALATDRLRHADPVVSHRLLPLVVEAASILDDLTAARAALEGLRRLAVHGSEAIVAAVRRADGTIALASGEDDMAVIELRAAVASFTEFGLHHDAALTRLGVAAAARGVDAHQVAEIELAAADQALAKIGARPFGIAARWAEVARRAPSTP